MEPDNLVLSFSFISRNDVFISDSISGVALIVTSSTGAIAETTPDKGLATCISFLPSFHLVFIDRESFPTGTEIFKSIHIFDKASTPFLKAESSCISPVGAIQFAET